jgi:hypothetical protein
MLANDVSEAKVLTPEQIAEWIQQLDSDDFLARNEAVQKLQAAGPVAFDALAEAAMGEGRDRRWQSLTLLRKAFDEGEPAWRQAAEQAFEKIAAGSKPVPASFARDLLKPRSAAAQNPVVTEARRPQPTPDLTIPAGASVHRTQMLQSGPCRVQVIECPRNGIEVHIVEIRDGVQVEQKGQGKDLAELAEKHPEVFKSMLAARRRHAASMLRNCMQQLDHCRGAIEVAANGAEDAEQLTQSSERLKAYAQQLEHEVSILTPQ